MIKKINKKITMLILIVLLISLSLGMGAYAAYVLNATEVQYTKADGNTVSVKAALDDLYAMPIVDYNAGDEVTVNGEPFFVLYDSVASSTTVTLLAKYNLNKTANGDGVYLQLANAKGTDTGCYFGESYWSGVFGQSWIYYNLNNVSGAPESGAIGRAKVYARYLGAVNGRLLTIEETENIRVNGTDEMKDIILGKANKQGSSSDYYLNFWLASIYMTQASDTYINVIHSGNWSVTKPCTRCLQRHWSSPCC